MTARATPEAVRSIMRRPHVIKGREKLNILTFCTHERYEQQLCKTGHNFYAINHGKRWDTDYGEIPKNYTQIDGAPPSHVDIDLVLCHTPCERLAISQKIKQDLNVPVILHTHTLPDIRTDTSLQVQQFQEASSWVDQRSFISKFNRDAWGCNESTAKYIEHGMDCDFWMDFDAADRDNVCLSVVNDWPNRDWCCGWELWKQTSQDLPLRVFGKSPGLSEPADSIEHLREIYHSSSIFYNTSIHSPVPTVLMEAMACGCAVVSTATCMIPEIIDHGKNGLISNDANDLRAMLESLLKNPDMARELGKNAQKTIREKYNLTQFVENWNNLLYSTIRDYKE
jgi:glycosyltransferase involved in cell wall biosynthesis